MKHLTSTLLLIALSGVCKADYPDPVRVQKNLELLVYGEKNIDQFTAAERVEMRVQIQKMRLAKQGAVGLGTPTRPAQQPVTKSPASQNSTSGTIAQERRLPTTPRGGYGYSENYEIAVSHNDELFIINDEKFSAKTFCFNMEKGDLVKFIEGSPYGACATAVLLNLRTKDICEVWCE